MKSAKKSAEDGARSKKSKGSAEDPARPKKSTKPGTNRTRVKKPGRKRPRTPPATVLGWREWVVLPELGVRGTKAKLDTGARTSALHAFRIKDFTRDGIEMVRFEVHPLQRSSAAAVTVEAEVVDRRSVRNSGGVTEHRPVISTLVQIGEMEWPIEVTLTRRDEMGFRMLLGRQALRGRALVDSGSSYRAGRRPVGPPATKSGEDE